MFFDFIYPKLLRLIFDKRGEIQMPILDIFFILVSLSLIKQLFSMQTCNIELYCNHVREKVIIFNFYLPYLYILIGEKGNLFISWIFFPEIWPISDIYVYFLHALCSIKIPKIWKGNKFLNALVVGGTSSEKW